MLDIKRITPLRVPYQGQGPLRRSDYYSDKFVGVGGQRGHYWFEKYPDDSQKSQKEIYDETLSEFRQVCDDEKKNLEKRVDALERELADMKHRQTKKKKSPKKKKSTKKSRIISPKSTMSHDQIRESRAAAKAMKSYDSVPFNDW